MIEQIENQNGYSTISGSEARHITRVLRMKPGDRLVLIDMNGLRFQAVIESIGSKDVRVAIEKPLPAPPPPRIEITLCQAVLRSQPMDYIIQKICELGVYRIIPFLSQRTVVKLNNRDLDNKIKHWQKIAQSATKQSGSPIMTKISHITNFQDMMSRLSEEMGVKVILWEEERSNDLKGFIRKTSFEEKIMGIVGPEGGFSPEEIKISRSVGFSSISLGHRILRAETAAVILSAVFQYEWGDLGSTNI
ncbi:MAG: 16S rRNA (uracil(1498)-N(3))-methyltransferase [Deltaproteobacteria bacterium]|nr:16S rRNA (uracil(1498)-N(3))-methyltransferase [Deltaproteobacteria bacterium]